MASAPAAAPGAPGAPGPRRRPEAAPLAGGDFADEAERGAQRLLVVGRDGRRRLGPRSVVLLRPFIGECLGVFIANTLTIAVLFAAASSSTAAQARTLLDTSASPALPPGAPGAVGNLVPDPKGSEPMPGWPGGHGSLPVNHLYVVFPMDSLFVAVGIGLAYAMGLTVCPGCSLNPTFSIASAFLERRPPLQVLCAVAGQMIGGIVACATMYSLGGDLFRSYVPDGDSYVLGDLPKLPATASLFGLSLPSESLSTGTVFCSTVLFTALMVVVVVPALTTPVGEQLPHNLRPWVIGLVIMPFAMVSSSLGVQNNASMYLSALIFCTAAGWPWSLWTACQSYVVIVLLAPLVGAVLGVLLLGSGAFLAWDPRSPIVWTEETLPHYSFAPAADHSGRGADSECARRGGASAAEVGGRA